MQIYIQNSIGTIFLGIKNPETKNIEGFRFQKTKEHIEADEEHYYTARGWFIPNIKEGP